MSYHAGQKKTCRLCAQEGHVARHCPNRNQASEQEALANQRNNETLVTDKPNSNDDKPATVHAPHVDADAETEENIGSSSNKSTTPPVVDDQCLMRLQTQT